MESIMDEKMQCVSCQMWLAKETKIPHPWMYGSACSRCMTFCQSTIARWTSCGALKCEDCSGMHNLTIHEHRIICFTCIKKSKSLVYHKIRHDWKEKVLSVQLGSGMSLKEKKPVRVLSLFDGIGTGYLVLDDLGFEIEEYFSCEIDDAAIAVLNFRFHDRMKHVGTVSNLSVQKLKSLGQIDILLGGSPCNQLSLANPRRKGLYDPQDTGVLFFDFDRILKFLQASAVNSGHHFFWLYENVAAMPHDYRDTISKVFQSKPAKWDAIKFLPAQRARLFWGNIPYLHDERQIDTPPPNLDDILEPYRKATTVTLNTVTTSYHSQLIGKEGNLPVIEDGKEDGLLITERERLFGFPTHYTDGPNLSIRQREILLGKAWSVPVIKSILTPLTKIYKMREQDKNT